MSRLSAWTAHHEHLLQRRLGRTIAGLLAIGVVCANPPVLAQPAATPTAAAATAAAAARVAMPPSTYVGSSTPGRAGVESSAVGLAVSLGSLPVREGAWGPWLRSGTAAVPPGRCPPAHLAVGWEPPRGDHEEGAYVGPLGPTPDDRTQRVNGVVVCRSSDFAFLGFEAEWDGRRWLLAAVPALADEGDEPLLAGEAEAQGATPAEADEARDGTPTLPQPHEWAGAPLEPLAAYVPQTTCDPVAKPGVLGFRDLLLATFPGSRNLGIGRVCEADGVSEHKEGRAFDWGVDIEDPAERAAADAVLAWMLGPDETGEPFAIARRLGLMYVIWDGRIWSSFQAAEGWRPYVGRSTHRDHIHFSFDWSGALARTSFWRGGSLAAGSTIPDLPLVPVAPRSPGPLPAVPPLPAPPAAPVPLPVVPPPPAATEGPPPPPAAATTTTSTTTTTTSAPPTTTTTSTTTTTTAPAVPLTTPTTFGL